jgi:hypothetical protein
MKTSKIKVFQRIFLADNHAENRVRKRDLVLYKTPSVRQNTYFGLKMRVNKLHAFLSVGWKIALGVDTELTSVRNDTCNFVICNQ